MKKNISIAFSTIIAMSVLVGCGGGSSNNTNNNSGSSPSQFSPVSNLIADLGDCSSNNSKYYAFEEWDPPYNDNEFRKLCITNDLDTSQERLEIVGHKLVSNAWVSDADNTTSSPNYLSRSYEAVIDMANVNNPNDIYPNRLFPAVKLSSSGGSGVFKSGAVEYKFEVFEKDIDGLLGTALPKGESVNSIIDNITFGTGDKLYRATITLQNDAYMIDKSFNFLNNTPMPNSNPQDYIVYDQTFSPMSIANYDVDTMLSSGNGVVIVDYEDNNNYLELSINTPYNLNSTNSLTAKKYVNGALSSTTSATYTKEVHNGESFIVANYNGEFMFLGKILSISSSSFVYGTKLPANLAQPVPITEGGTDRGDFMDDIMLNSSARDRVLNALSLTAP